MTIITTTAEMNSKYWRCRTWVRRSSTACFASGLWVLWYSLWAASKDLGCDAPGDISMTSKKHSTQTKMMKKSFGLMSNEQVSDRSQPPLMLDLSLREPAGSGSLHRLVGRNFRALL